MAKSQATICGPVPFDQALKMFMAAGALALAVIQAYAGGKYSGGEGDGWAMLETNASLGGIQAALSSASDQVFARTTNAQAIGTITITDGAPAPIISAAADIRITIPVAWRIAWNPAVLTPVFGGSAAGKVNATVSYENTDRTLVVDVTSGFAAGDTLTIGGLSFSSAGAALRPAKMELDITHDGLADAYDAKTIAVSVPRPGGIGDGWAMTAMTIDVLFPPKGTIFGTW